MKATIIFSILFVLFFLNGCSDSILDPVDQKISSYSETIDGKTEDVPDVPVYQLVWKLDDLSVITSMGSIYPNGLENWATYINDNHLLPDSYVVTFNTYSNADRWTNGFEPYARIEADREIVFTKNDFNDDDSHFTSISLENFSQLNFYVALFPVNGFSPVNEDVPRDVIVKLTDIKVYAVR
jgi:hypothetical protein